MLMSKKWGARAWVIGPCMGLSGLGAREEDRSPGYEQNRAIGGPDIAGCVPGLGP